MESVRMAFAECVRCQSSVRVWEEESGARLSEAARGAPDAAVLDLRGEFECPSCGARQWLPAEGVYVIYDREEQRVRFVGRSKDVKRRLEWWQRTGGRYANRVRYRGVQLATTDTLPDVAWFAAGDAQG